MASSSRGGGSAAVDPRKAAVEASEFPILCESCLGPNPYVRMLQDKWGKPCKVCERPFTVFRWKPAGNGMRYKNTEVCQTCARLKNVCQTCVLDLSYGLPVQVRDAAMAAGDRQVTVAPSSDAAKQYVAAQGDRAIASGQVDAVYAAPMANNIAEKSKRTGPRYERNRAQLCSWFAKGQCSKGVYCQYRHELPRDKAHPLAKQNIVDRFYGINDPVAAGIMARTSTAAKRRGKGGASSGREAPPAPEDESIVSLFVGGVTPLVTEMVIRALFEKHEAGISEIRIIVEKSIAFIDFASRAAAEAAIAEKHGRLEIADTTISISWARGSGGAPGRGDNARNNHGKRRAPQHNNMYKAPQGQPAYVPPAAPLVDLSGVVPGVQPPPGGTQQQTLDSGDPSQDGPQAKRLKVQPSFSAT